MLEQTKRIPVSFRISSVLSKVELEPGAGPFTPAPAPTKKYRLQPAPAVQHWTRATILAITLQCSEVKKLSPVALLQSVLIL